MGEELLPEIERRRATYLNGRPSLDLKGKNLIVVDDGVATGATLQASLKVLHAKQPKSVIVALPVGPPDLPIRLRGLVDQVICLRGLGTLGAVGGAYHRFDQVNDATVRANLVRFSMQTEP